MISPFEIELHAFVSLNLRILVCMSCMFLASYVLDCIIDMFLTLALDCMVCMSCLRDSAWNA